MKYKLSIIVLILFTSFMVCYDSILSSHYEWNNNSVIEATYINEQTKENEHVFQYSMTSEKPDFEFIDRLSKQLSNENKIMFIRTSYEKDNNNVFKCFVLSKNEHLFKEWAINNSHFNTYSYASSKSNTVYSLLRNNNMEHEFYNINLIKEKFLPASNTYSIRIFSNLGEEELVNKYNLKNSKDIYQIDFTYEVDQITDSYTNSVNINKSYYIILGVVLSLLSFVYVQIVKENRKEVTIRKMNGYSNLSILHLINLKFNILVVAAMFIGFIAAILYLKININPMSIYFLKQLLIYLGVCLLIIVFLNIISYLIIRSVKITEIKGSEEDKKYVYFLNINQSLFVYISICFIFSSITLFKLLPQYLDYLDKYKDEPFYTVEYNSKINIDPEKESTQEELNNLDKDAKERMIVDNYIKKNSLYLELGVFNYNNDNKDNDSQFYLISNKKLLDYVDIKFKNNIKPFLDDNKNYLLKPMNLNKVTLYNSLELDKENIKYEVIDIEDKQRFTVPLSNGNVWDNAPILIKANKDIILTNNYLVDKRNLPRNMLLNDLKNLKVDISKITCSNYHFLKNEVYKQNVRKSYTLIIIGIFMVISQILIIYFFTKIYFINNKKLLAIKILNGNNFFEKYSKRFIEIIGIYGLVFILITFCKQFTERIMLTNVPEFHRPAFVYNYKYILGILALIMLFDVSFTVFQIRKLEKSVVHTLKES